MEESFEQAWRDLRWKDKLAATFTNSAGKSGDKLATLVELTIFAAQHGMVVVSLGLPPGAITSSGSDCEANRLSSFLGLMTQSYVDLGPEQTPPEGDRRTAIHFGERVAVAAMLGRPSHSVRSCMQADLEVERTEHYANRRERGTTISGPPLLF